MIQLVMEKVCSISGGAASAKAEVSLQEKIDDRKTSEPTKP
jgi:hypothetical protein